MPKSALTGLPVAALFAIKKPSGPTCMSIINSLKPLLLTSKLFMNPSEVSRVRAAKKQKKKRPRDIDIKVGQGGTLDPLASGVLVIGAGRRATKALGRFLDCDKEYDATVLLGSSTDTYDSEGSIVTRAPWSHVNESSVTDIIPRFTGKIEQIPPIYSALKMDGKPLYEYARKGIPLPRPIEKRSVTVHSLILQSFQQSQQHSSQIQSENSTPQDPPTGHTYTPPVKEFTQEEREALHTMLHSTSAENEFPSLSSPTREEKYPDSIPPVFTIRVACSGGTYIRNLAHDIGLALGSAAHIVKLERVKQGEWSLDRAIDHDVFVEALKAYDTSFDEGVDESTSEPIDGEWTEWEEKVMKNWEIIEPDANEGKHFDGRNTKRFMEQKRASSPQGNRNILPPKNPRDTSEGKI